MIKDENSVYFFLILQMSYTYSLFNTYIYFKIGRRKQKTFYIYILPYTFKSLAKPIIVMLFKAIESLQFPVLFA